MKCRERTALETLWRCADLVSVVLIVSGAYVSIIVGVPGAFLMLAGLAVSLVVHLVVGVIGYRRVMRRQWPDVRPVDDQDEW